MTESENTAPETEPTNTKAKTKTKTKIKTKTKTKAKSNVSVNRKIFYGSLAIFGVAAFSVVMWMTTMPGSSFTGEPPALKDSGKQLSANLKAHVEVLAGQIGSRNHVFQDSYDKAKKYLLTQLTELGYKPREMPYQVNSTTTATNIEIIIPGKKSSNTADKFLVIGAHYDTYVDTPGANDNGSGVAVCLELARLLKGYQGDLSLRIAFFANEEPPHFARKSMGSLHYANQLIDTEKQKIVGMLSIETVGYYTNKPNTQHYPFPFSVRYPNTGNFLAFVGNPESRTFTQDCVRLFRKNATIPSEGATIPASVQGVDWSDHRSFWYHDIPAIMITDTALNRYSLYHTPDDTPDKLDYEALARVTTGLKQMIEDYVGEQK